MSRSILENLKFLSPVFSLNDTFLLGLAQSSLLSKSEIVSSVSSECLGFERSLLEDLAGEDGRDPDGVTDRRPEVSSCGGVTDLRGSGDVLMLLSSLVLYIDWKSSSLYEEDISFFSTFERVVTSRGDLT